MAQRTSRKTTIIGTHKIILDDQTVPYTVKRSPRARHVRLEIRVTTGLTIVVPGSYNTEELTSDVNNGLETYHAATRPA